MKWMKFGFLKHYRKIKIEGIDPKRILNKCLKNRITLQDLRWRDDISYTAKLQGDDYHKVKRMAGHTYQVTVLGEGGLVPAICSVKRNIAVVMGAFFLGALLFYQSLFIAEIQVDGYRSLEEAEIRSTLKEAGVVEGARRQGDYAQAKELLYQTYDSLTWVSFYEEGRLLHVDLAEGGSPAKEPKATKLEPVDIVASRSGLIQQILPLQGNAKVQKGDYVNKGDLLISGRYKYRSTDYSRGDEEFIQYQHAQGRVLARVPCRLEYYFEKKERQKTETGNYFTGIAIRLGDFSFDSTEGWGGYEASVRKEHKLFDFVRPLPFSLRLVTVKEVSLSEKERTPESLQKTVEAALRDYEKKSLKDGERILGQEVTYSDQEGLIKADALLEVEKDIGVEKKIDVKKEEKAKKKK